MAKTFDDLVLRTTTKKTRLMAAGRTQELLGELLLSELRRATGKSQQEVADLLGIKQPSLSKLEQQHDIRVSTLQKIIAALGGKLEILARFPQGRVKVRAGMSTKPESLPKRLTSATSSKRSRPPSPPGRSASPAPRA